jgi:signal transduction histidine kinase
VLLQIQAELKLRLDEAGARLVIPDGPPLVLCDRTRLYQLFSNLIGNALQHMGECEDRTIAVEIARLADEDVITVSDHGQGIEAAELSRIFDPFYGRSRSKSGGPSTGVGLAIVRKIAELHGGRATVESPLGGGAVFRVTLPRE